MRTFLAIIICAFLILGWRFLDSERSKIEVDIPEIVSKSPKYMSGKDSVAIRTGENRSDTRETRPEAQRKLETIQYIDPLALDVSAETGDQLSIGDYTDPLDDSVAGYDSSPVWVGTYTDPLGFTESVTEVRTQIGDFVDPDATTAVLGLERKISVGSYTDPGT